MVFTVSSAEDPSQSGQTPTPDADTSDAAAGRSVPNSDSGYTRFEAIETKNVRDALAFETGADSRHGKWVWYTGAACLLAVITIVFGVGAAVGAGGTFLAGMAAEMSANERVVHAVLDVAEAGDTG